MRTNEELAVLAKEGDKDATRELWERNYRYICKVASRYFPFCNNYGVAPEDILQESYFGLQKAIRYYHPDKSIPFLNYLGYAVRTVACNMLGYKRKNKPFLVSIEELLPGTENMTIGDTLADEGAQAEVEDTVENYYYKQLRECLEECLRALPKKQAQILRLRYYEELTQQQTADSLGLTMHYVQAYEGLALWQLMRKHSRKLLAFKFYYDFDYYKLPVEKHVEKREKREFLMSYIEEIEKAEISWKERITYDEPGEIIEIPVVRNTPSVPQSADGRGSATGYYRSADAV